MLAAADLPGWFWEAIAGLGVVVVLFGGAIPSIRSSKAKQTIDLQAAELTASEQARKSQEMRFTQQMAEQEQRCSAQIANMERRHASDIGELRGQVAAMTPQFARTLAELLREQGVQA